jgi:hypothetical protein
MYQIAHGDGAGTRDSASSSAPAVSQHSLQAETVHSSTMLGDDESVSASIASAVKSGKMTALGASTSAGSNNSKKGGKRKYDDDGGRGNVRAAVDEEEEEEENETTIANRRIEGEPQDIDVVCGRGGTYAIQDETTERTSLMFVFL